MSAPWIESGAARIGVVVLVVLSVSVGYQYWIDQGDRQLAYLTVGAEIVAAAGLALAWHHGWTRWGRALGALLVTALAAAWCGMTMFEKIEADTRAQAVAQAQERPAYVFAANAAQTASSLLQDRLRSPNPRPQCACPDTIRAWEASEAAAIERLRAERDAAIAQMESAIPPPQTDWIAIVRGVGVEIAKLLGFAVFGLAVSSGPKPSQPNATGPPWWAAVLRPLRLGGIAGATALASTPAYAGQPVESVGVSPISGPDPIVRLPETSKRAKAFALRGRMRPVEIAHEVGVSRATVYRWFRARDLQQRAA